jgi:phenylpropionate dioxygenase-like ring-hydroxylating dioxygenase large terminal subunit
MTKSAGSNVDADEGWSLPAWTYSDPAFFAAEVERVFRPSWQVVCHESDVANAGDYHTIDYIGESVVVVRGHDSRLRAFTNVCRHRGSRLLDTASGCAKTLVCPYHAWTYNLDGSCSTPRRAARRRLSAPITPGPTISTAPCAAFR